MGYVHLFDADEDNGWGKTRRHTTSVCSLKQEILLYKGPLNVRQATTQSETRGRVGRARSLLAGFPAKTTARADGGVVTITVPIDFHSARTTFYRYETDTVEQMDPFLAELIERRWNAAFAKLSYGGCVTLKLDVQANFLGPNEVGTPRRLEKTPPLGGLYPPGGAYVLMNRCSSRDEPFTPRQRRITAQRRRPHRRRPWRHRRRRSACARSPGHEDATAIGGDQPSASWFALTVDMAMVLVAVLVATAVVRTAPSDRGTLGTIALGIFGIVAVRAVVVPRAIPPLTRFDYLTLLGLGIVLVAWCVTPLVRWAVVVRGRELIEPNPGDKRYIRRDDKGRFTPDQVDVGRSLSHDTQHRAKRVVPPGQGDKGDRRRSGR